MQSLSQIFHHTILKVINSMHTECHLHVREETDAAARDNAHLKPSTTKEVEMTCRVLAHAKRAPCWLQAEVPGSSLPF